MQIQWKHLGRFLAISITLIRICQISQIMKKNPVVQKEVTCSFPHDHLCPIIFGKLFDEILEDIFPFD